MEDLTVELRSPIFECRSLMAAIAFLRRRSIDVEFTRGGEGAFLGAALMMILFFQAARIAMATFDPYLSSRPLAKRY
jgi:hypothetical protein